MYEYFPLLKSFLGVFRCISPKLFQDLTNQQITNLFLQRNRHFEEVSSRYPKVCLRKGETLDKFSVDKQGKAGLNHQFLAFQRKDGISQQTLCSSRSGCSLVKMFYIIYQTQLKCVFWVLLPQPSKHFWHFVVNQLQEIALISVPMSDQRY